MIVGLHCRSHSNNDNGAAEFRKLIVGKGMLIDSQNPLRKGKGDATSHGRGKAECDVFIIAEMLETMRMMSR